MIGDSVKEQTAMMGGAIVRQQFGQLVKSDRRAFVRLAKTESAVHPD